MEASAISNLKIRRRRASISGSRAVPERSIDPIRSGGDSVSLLPATGGEAGEL